MKTKKNTRFKEDNQNVPLASRNMKQLLLKSETINKSRILVFNTI